LTDKQCYVKEPITPWKRQNSICVLSIFGQFDFKLETSLLKSENRFHAQHLLLRAIDKLTDDHVNDLSAVALATDMVNKTHSFINIVSIEG
jgi:HJR/Mrr/RecB family endonuclease